MDTNTQEIPETYYLITEDTTPDDAVRLIASHAPQSTIQILHAHDIKHEWLEQCPPHTILILYLSDNLLKQIITQVSGSHCTIAILPHPDSPNAVVGYGLSTKMADAVYDIFNHDTHSIDLLVCNNEAVLNSVEIGDFLGLKPVNIGSGSLFDRLKVFFQQWRKLLVKQPFKITLVTQKEKSISTAVLAISIVEHARNTRYIQELIGETNINDGLFHTFLFSPRSIRQLIFGMFCIAIKPSSKLPEFIGHIKAGALNITCESTINYRIDSQKAQAEALQLSIIPRAINLIPGKYLTIDKPAATQKESYRVQHLPTGDTVNELVTKHLPWHLHAGTDEFRDIYNALKDNATLSANYLTLMVLSTLLATLGLFANAAAVLIGAMLLAPLMGPIISAAMGVVRQDFSLISLSCKALLAGLSLALFFSVVLTLIIPLQFITTEMAARASPTLLDLGVAIISGIAGAYAHARAEIAKSLAGVAIAVALIPPIATTGIGIGWLDWTIVFGSFLLFLTNLAGIVLAAAATFFWLGFSPFTRAKKGLLFSIMLTCFVAIPLATSFYKIVQKNRWEIALSTIPLKNADLRNVVIRRSDPLSVHFELVTNQPPKKEELDSIKKLMEEKIQRPLQIEMTVIIKF